MMKPQVRMMVFSLLLGLGTGVAHASSIDGTDPSKILAVAKGFGYAELTTDPTGDPHIVGRVDGLKYHVVFYGCKNHVKCQSIDFSTGWSMDTKPTQEAINKWNESRRFSKAYLDSDGDPRLEYSVVLKHGVSTENLAENFDLWVKSMHNFQSELAD